MKLHYEESAFILKSQNAYQSKSKFKTETDFQTTVVAEGLSLATAMRDGSFKDLSEQLAWVWK